MNAYLFRATCPEHGQMEPLTQGKVIADECSAIFRCPVCRVDYQVHVYMKPVIQQFTGRCGTTAGAQRHRRYGEELCEPCRTAWNTYENAMKSARKARAREMVDA